MRKITNRCACLGTIFIKGNVIAGLFNHLVVVRIY